MAGFDSNLKNLGDLMVFQTTFEKWKTPSIYEAWILVTLVSKQFETFPPIPLLKRKWWNKAARAEHDR